MDKLEELVQAHCPQGAKYVLLESVCQISKGIQFNKSDMNDSGTYPVINGGITASGYIEQYNQEENTITISQGGASAGYVNWIETKFWAGAHCYVLKPSDKVLNRYLFHFVKSKEQKLQECQYGAGIPALAKSTVASLQIPLPPLAVQQEIVRILDSFTELTAELTARRKQYEHYRDELLTFGDEVPKMPIAQCTERTKNIKWKENTAEYRYIDLTSVNLKNHQIESTTLISASDAPSRAQQLVKENDILFGTTRPMLQRQCLVPQCYDGQICSTGFCVLRTKIGVLLPEMLYYLMQTKAFYTYVERNQKGASYPSISDADVKRFEIPIVSIPEQKSIVTLLKHFDVLCNDLTSGLPAEITARQKQYEYYRDKLLTFKELDT